DLAVASNKYQTATDKLARHYFGPEVFRIILGQRKGIPAKPDPAIVYEILERTGYTPPETLYVGDSGVDMQTALRSGVESVGVSWGFRPREELVEYGAVHLADRADQIWEWIAP
ncbi:MAG: HAD-IA family hydrolase, partial [Rikenellaceae bacterium]|nr:HAD-IA family hydrolase [Rikenellaceae bacterium]